VSEALEVRAEVLKLARLLGCQPSDLEYLTAVPSADVRVLRDQVTEVLFSSAGPALGRLAAGSKLLPVGVVASLGEHVFGPVISARVAGLLEPARAVEMAAKLPTPFLADVAIDLDPRRARDVIARIPPHRVAEISRELVGRGEYVTMGRFVGYLGDDAIRAAIGVTDDRSLLHIAFVLESKDKLVALADMLGEDRLELILDEAAAGDLWAEALDLLNHLSEAQRATLANAAAKRDDTVLAALVATAQEEELWGTLLSMVGLMSDESRRRFAALKVIHDEVVLESVVRAAAEQEELWQHLVPLVSVLPEATREHVASLVENLGLDADVLGPLRG
jgi:hypothetical protein